MHRSVVFATPADFDGGFQFCRLVFRNDRNGDGGGWSVDWPRADENLSVRLSELTRLPVSVDENSVPKHLLVRLTDPELFHCPFVMMTEPGGTYFDDQEAAGLRSYLLHGGFLWADDFWGSTPSGSGKASCAKRCPPQTIRSSICRSTIRSSTR